MEKKEPSKELDTKNTNMVISEDAKRRYRGEMSDEEMYEKYSSKGQRAFLAVEIVALIEEDKNREREKRKLQRKDLAKNRKEVFEALGGKCFVCDFDFSDLLHIHHKVRLVDGGSNEIENLVLLCPNCHRLIHYFAESFSSKEKIRYEDNLRLINIEDWMNNNLTPNEIKNVANLFTILVKE